MSLCSKLGFLTKFTCACPINDREHAQVKITNIKSLLFTNHKSKDKFPVFMRVANVIPGDPCCKQRNSEVGGVCKLGACIR